MRDGAERDELHYESLYVNNAVYAANGQVSALPYGSALTATTTTTFNTRFQPAQIQAGTLLTLGYSYGTSNNSGNVQSATMTRGSQTWTPAIRHRP